MAEPCSCRYETGTSWSRREVPYRLPSIAPSEGRRRQRIRLVYLETTLCIILIVLWKWQEMCLVSVETSITSSLHNLGRRTIGKQLESEWDAEYLRIQALYMWKSDNILPNNWFSFNRKYTKYNAYVKLLNTPRRMKGSYSLCSVCQTIWLAISIRYALISYLFVKRCIHSNNYYLCRVCPWQCPLSFLP